MAMADAGNDPVALWHNMLGEMEKGFNAFASQALGSSEFSRVVNQVGGVSAGAQKQLGDLMEKYLTSMNMPSRAQMINFGERLTAIETQLGDITTLLRQNLAASAGAPGATVTPAPAEATPLAQPATPVEAAVSVEAAAPFQPAARPAPKPRPKRPPELARK